MSAFENFQKFVFDVPLYDPLELPTAHDHLRQMFRHGFIADGFCPWCKAPSTFRPSEFPSHLADQVGQDRLEGKNVQLTVACARNRNHEIEIWARIVNGCLVKYGQTPSLADITQAEAQRFTKVLDRQDATEFNRAIGLAAHGVGIGSFVYLRRIFERLIDKRYTKTKDETGVEEEAFKKARMDDKVKLLQGHLPEFLVANRRIYSFLSLGIHELGEEQCLDIFAVLRLSIEAILEEDEVNRQKAEKRAVLEKALQTLDQTQGGKPAGTGDPEPS